MARRLVTVSAVSLAFLVLGSSAAFACGGLIASLEKGHAEVLRRATTLAAWHDGREHYITGFKFAGNADSFGYLIPLPAIPEKIEKGGEWTLERLLREVAPPVQESAADAGTVAFSALRAVVVHKEVQVDALNIKVISGGATEIVQWAKDNGFGLDHDSDSMFAHYTKSKAVFAAAKFDSLLAKDQGLVEGQGTTIHFTIPLSAPWIPLKILSLGKGGVEPVRADLFVLTSGKPVFFPKLSTIAGMDVIREAPASDILLADLRGDAGMEWVPTSAYLTAMTLDAPASTVDYDLSIDGGVPVGAPIPLPEPRAPIGGTWLWWTTAAALLALILGALRRSRPQTGMA